MLRMGRSGNGAAGCFKFIFGDNTRANGIGEIFSFMGAEGNSHLSLLNGSGGPVIEDRIAKYVIIGIFDSDIFANDDRYF